MSLQLLHLKLLQIQPCFKDSHSQYHCRPEDTPPSSRHMLVGQKEMASLLTTYSIERRLTKLPSRPGACNKKYQTQMAFFTFPQNASPNIGNMFQSSKPTAPLTPLRPGSHATTLLQAQETQRPERLFSVENHQKGTCSLFPDSCPAPGLKDKTSN